MKYMYSLFFLLLISYLLVNQKTEPIPVVIKKINKNNSNYLPIDNPISDINYQEMEPVKIIQKDEILSNQSDSVYENITDHNNNDNLKSVILNISDEKNIDIKFTYKNEEYIYRGEINDKMIFESPESNLFFCTIERFNKSYIFKIFPKNVANDVSNEIAILVQQEFAEDINAVTTDFNNEESLSPADADKLLDIKRLKIRHAMSDLMFDQTAAQQIKDLSNNE